MSFKYFDKIKFFHSELSDEAVFRQRGDGPHPHHPLGQDPLQSTDHQERWTVQDPGQVSTYRSGCRPLCRHQRGDPPVLLGPGGPRRPGRGDDPLFRDQPSLLDGRPQCPPGHRLAQDRRQGLHSEGAQAAARPQAGFRPLPRCPQRSGQGRPPGQGEKGKEAAGLFALSGGAGRRTTTCHFSPRYPWN